MDYMTISHPFPPFSLWYHPTSFHLRNQPPLSESPNCHFYFFTPLHDIKNRLQLDNQLPLVVGHLIPIELLERVDAGARNVRVEHVLLLEVATVGGLVRARLDLDGHRRLTLFADWHLLVVALD